MAHSETGSVGVDRLIPASLGESCSTALSQPGALSLGVAWRAAGASKADPEIHQDPGTSSLLRDRIPEKCIRGWDTQDAEGEEAAPEEDLGQSPLEGPWLRPDSTGDTGCKLLLRICPRSRPGDWTLIHGSHWEEPSHGTSVPGRLQLLRVQAERLAGPGPSSDEDAGRA